jgi:DNA-binding NtrC family response regulator
MGTNDTERSRSTTDRGKISGNNTERDAQSGARRVTVFSPAGSAVYELPARGSLTIGRTRSADIPIEHGSVSRKHAVLHVSASIRVEDCGSMNGTRVGGKKLKSSQIADVPPGTVVEIGKAMLVISGEGVPSAREIEDAPPPSFVVRDASMERLYRLVDMVAKSDISVLLYGETGVGKEVFAQTIHKRSPRAQKPFVGLNCAALPENLLESELFGYERGAFTGAVQPKAGLLESAQGGTVFLDEVGEMPMSAQAKLLRALERREVIRLGATVARPIDVRFISATNRNLEDQSAKGLFRQDLFFRLDGISVQIPPLRDRKSEIVPLARQFVAEVARRAGVRAPALSDDAIAALDRHAWPGNVRELRNVIERAVLLASGGTLRGEHIVMRGVSMPPPAPAGPADARPLTQTTQPPYGGAPGGGPYASPPPFPAAPPAYPGAPGHTAPMAVMPNMPAMPPHAGHGVAGVLPPQTSWLHPPQPAGFVHGAPHADDRTPDTPQPHTRPAQPIATPYTMPQEIGGLHKDLAELERQRIIEALERTGGNQKEAAELLGISRRTLISRLDEYKLPRPRKR